MYYWLLCGQKPYPNAYNQLLTHMPSWRSLNCNSAGNRHKVENIEMSNWVITNYPVFEAEL